MSMHYVQSVCGESIWCVECMYSVECICGKCVVSV